MADRKTKATGRKPRNPPGGGTKGKALRHYTDQEKVTALVALESNGGNVHYTAGKLGIPKQTLEEWSNGRVDPSIVKASKEKRAPLADCLEGIARTLLGDLYDEKRREFAPLKDVATAMAIAIDKARLLREQPTNITGHAELSDAELYRRLELLAKRVKEQQALAGPEAAPPGDNPEPQATDLVSLPRPAE